MPTVRDDIKLAGKKGSFGGYLNMPTKLCNINRFLNKGILKKSDRTKSHESGN